MDNKIKTSLKRLQYISEWRKNNPEKVKANYLKYNQKNPWLKRFYSAKKRCMPEGIYFRRGIKFLLSIDDVKYLWSRDQAHQMQKPSIDRIDGLKNYTIKNCRFIEYQDNLSRPRYKRASGWDIYIKCKSCHRNDRKYNGHGLCVCCYTAWYRRKFGRLS